MQRQGQTQTWIIATQRGDRLALAKLLAAYHPGLRARAEARIDPAIRTRIGPDDILQEVYLQVFRQIDRFEDRGPDSLLKWVCTILDHKIEDARRAAHRQVRDVAREVPAAARANSSSYWDLLDQLYADSGTPSRAVRREEALTALEACIRTLAPAQRQVIELRFLQGLSVGVVSARMGKSADAVVTLTRRALEALRQAMDRRGEFTRGG